MTTITALAVIGSPHLATCPTCHHRGHVTRDDLLPVPHADGCQVLAEERVLLRDDLVQAEIDGSPFHRHPDPHEGDLLAALAITLDDEALVRVEVVDGHRVRTFAVADEAVAVLW